MNFPWQLFVLVPVLGIMKEVAGSKRRAAATKKRRDMVRAVEDSASEIKIPITKPFFAKIGEKSAAHTDENLERLMPKINA